MEHKTLSFEIKAVDYDGRTLEGFAAAFGNIDQVGDIIHPGAFKKTLTERGQRIKFLWQHDPTEPIGKLLSAHEDTGGLFVKAVISDTQRGRDALALLKDGAIGEMSIGYDTVKGGMDYTKDAKTGNTVRNLREIKLYEFSLVTFPANEMAIVTGVKEQDVTPSEGKPYRNVPDELTDKMDSCVEKVQAQGNDKETAIAICYASVVEGKSLDTIIEEHHLLFTKGGGPTSQKAGRVLSAANMARIKTAMDSLHEALMSAGMWDEEAEEYDKSDIDKTEVKSIINPASPERADESDNQQLNSTAAGPVQPPTEAKLKLIDLELSELTSRR